MGTISIMCKCPICGASHEVDNIKPHDYNRWVQDELIQRAMPYLSPTEREQLISGICPDCQSHIFGG